MLGFSAFLLALGWPAPVTPAPYLVPEKAGLAASSPANRHIWRDGGDRFAWHIFDRPIFPTVLHQVRIEQHIIIRVVPRPSRDQQELMNIERQASSPPRFIERSMGRCIAIADIGGVQPDGDSRLLLFMRDRRLISADLERGCSARDFYSGFYIAHNKDGKMCVGRDKLLARSGMRCAISAIHLLEPEGDR